MIDKPCPQPREVREIFENLSQARADSQDETEWDCFDRLYHAATEYFGDFCDREFLVTLNYQTEGGDGASCRVHVKGVKNEDAAITEAQSIARKDKRRKIGSFVGGDVERVAA